MISRNQIFTEIKNAIKQEYPNAYVVGSRVPSPSAFPCVWVVEMDTYPTTQGTTLDLTDEQRQSVFEVQAFSNLDDVASLEVEKLV